MFPTHHMYPNPNTWKPPPSSLPSVSPQASGRTATPPPSTLSNHKMPSKPLLSSSSKTLPCSPSSPGVIHYPSPPLVEWNEYITVQSALQSFEDRFEEFMREQSRLLGEVYRGFVGHEKALKKLGRRVEVLEERVEGLNIREKVEGKGEIGSGKGKERRVGRFVVVEGKERDHVEGLELNSDHEPAPQVLPSPVTKHASTPNKPKSDEQAWEEFLGFGYSTRNADLRPQHGYRRLASRLTADTGSSTAQAGTEKADLADDSGTPQEVKRLRSGHSPAPQVLPPSDGSGNLSVMEMLDQLGEELMGFERERKGRDEGRGNGKVG
ncbi:hypothetical protein Slin15195_G048560 [Septoria linicola]|uniref:Uncharacterized protein n=1 Tax=Septoria linicola TaxID=215465 RepID=A0A9Q9AT50_9PEZI|nr:hypothetical protein Slin14017_G052120 [Septoria linicola]USW51537.1 hypothetical protein Slin15195_G048560 [Septoria linicola]